MAVNHVPIDPYTLTSGDHLGLALVSQPLTKTNYNSWVHSMRMVLNSKRKFGFVDGSIPKPPPDADPDLITSW